VKGRPLRFLALTLGGWTAARVALLWPAAPSLPDLLRLPLPGLPIAAASAATLPRLLGSPAAPAMIAVAEPTSSRPAPAPITAEPASAPRASDPRRVALALATMVRFGREQVDQTPGLPPPLPPTPPARPPGRLAGSAWLIARGGGSDGRVPGAQLGGSQAGMRLTYAVDAARRLAIAGRVSTPLEGRGREAALGVEWRPFDAPVRLLAEQRWALDGGRGGPTAMIVGGLPPTRIGPLEAEAYAQAGAIARGGVDLFADGAARLSAPVTTGRLRLDLGAGTWGGAQPGASRVDVGPTLGLRVPAGRRQVRVSLDWRQRVAGRARPGSGPALSIGSDF
jgi:hypothetical protein